MKVFKRDITEKIEGRLWKGDIIIIYGPRQAGKTTLSKTIISKYKDISEYYNCEEIAVRDYFIEGNPDKLKELIGDKKLVVFDEAQTIFNIGRILKVFYDKYKDLNIQIIATGSSSFDLANKIVEPLTGRAIEFNLLPLSINEIRNIYKEADRELDLSDLYSIMKYGSYPEIISKDNEEEKLISIKKIANNYLYKDIFILENIKNPKSFEDILKMLAGQIGSLVSIAEIARAVGVSRQTVDRYIRLLEQAFIIKRVYSFSNNPRTELKKAFKIYFIDIGVRNTLININIDIENAKDKGFVLENLFLLEILKYSYLNISPAEIMFWRDKSGIEIDFIIKDGANILARECKWSEQDVSFNKFLKLYPGSDVGIVTVNDILNNVINY